MKTSPKGILSVLALIVLLLSPGLALEGAKRGLLLWANVMVPALLPFMVCVGAVAALGGIPLIVRPFLPILTGLLGLSPQGSFVLISGLLCGYPMGAKLSGDFLKEGRIRLPEGRLLLAVSNHPSPMFLLGFVLPKISAFLPLHLLLLCLYLPLLPMIALAGHVYHVPKARLSQSPLLPLSQARETASQTPDPDKAFSFDDHLMSSLETMERIGGYIMLFSILSLYLSSLPLPPRLLSCLLGITEITTGIEAISLRETGAFMALLILASTAFGGISGLFQTKSVLKNAGLSIRHYIFWKLLHCGLSSCLYILLHPLVR